MSEKSPKSIGSYEILEELSHNEMATVYKGVEPQSNREVAIKLLSQRAQEQPEYLERIEKEADALTRIEHPNIVKVLESARDEEGNPFIVMEFVEWPSLAKRLKTQRPSLSEATTLIKQIAKGLEHAHGNQIVHRDLNPTNVFVSENFKQAKLADFNLSRLEFISMQHSGSSTMTAANFRYVAPEQAIDFASADNRSNIYSLGALFYELLTGSVPYGRFSLPSQVNNDLPPDIDPIILRCLSKDVRERYPTVRQLVSDIERIENTFNTQFIKELRGISRSTEEIVRKSTQTLSGKSARTLGIGLASLLVLLSVGFFLMRDNGDEPDLAATMPERLSSQPVPLDERSRPEARNDLAGFGSVGQSSRELAIGDPEPETDLPVRALSSEGGQVPDTGGSAPAPAPSSPSSRLSSALEAARSELDTGSPEQVLSGLEEIMRDYSDLPAVGEAFLMAAGVHEEAGRTSEARTLYVRMARELNHPSVAEGQYRLAQLMSRSDVRSEREQTTAVLAGVANNYPDTEWAPLALWQKAKIETQSRIRVLDSRLKKRVPIAFLTYRKIAEGYPSHEAAEEAYWNLAQTYEQLNNWELAIRTYTKLGDTFTDTKLEAWWKAGQLCERRLRDEARARASYSRIPPDGPRYSDAQKRLEGLGAGG